MPLMTAAAVVVAAHASPFCIAAAFNLQQQQQQQQRSNNNPRESATSSSVNTNNDPMELLPQLHTYQKPRQKRRPLSRPRKPRFYWHDEENVKKELISFWDELNVPIHKYNPQQSPPIPSEFLLNHFNRNDLRWGIAQFGGREHLSHVFGGAIIIPGKWKEAKELDIIQSILPLVDDDDRGNSKRSTRRKSVSRATNNNNDDDAHNKEPLAAMVDQSTAKPRKQFWTKEQAICDLYSYLDNYKKYKSRPSVWMPQLSELKHEEYSKLFNACSRFKKLPHGAEFANLRSQRLSDENASIEYVAGLVPFKEWRFFESQLQLFVELQHYLNLHHNGSEEVFPDPADVKSHGHEQLSMLIRNHGGKQLLAQKLDMMLVSKVSIQSWGPFSLDFAIDLLQFIRERYVTMSPPLPYPVISMPSERDLKRFGYEDLCQKCERFGGYENVARRLGLSFFDAGKQHQLDEEMIRGAKKLWKKRNA